MHDYTKVFFCYKLSHGKLSSVGPTSRNLCDHGWSPRRDRGRREFESNNFPVAEPCLKFKHYSILTKNYTLLHSPPLTQITQLHNFKKDKSVVFRKMGKKGGKGKGKKEKKEKKEKVVFGHDYYENRVNKAEADVEESTETLDQRKMGLDFLRTT